MIWIIDIILILIILFVIYWFWLYKAKSADVINKHQAIDVIVDNGVYTPGSIQSTVGEPVTLRFTRKAASPCASTVVFADFDQSAELPLNQTVEITVTPDKVGEFDFTCEMGMYRGKLIVI